jgi:hypothetical protein
MYIYVCMHVYYTIYLSEVGQVLLISGIHGPDVQMQVTRPRVSVHLRVARKDAVHLLPDGGGHERTGPACSRGSGNNLYVEASEPRCSPFFHASSRLVGRHQRTRKPFCSRQQALNIPTVMRDVDVEAPRACRIFNVGRRRRRSSSSSSRSPPPLGASPGAREGIAETLLLLLCLALLFI